MSTNDINSPPPSILTWNPPKPGATPVARIRLQDWEAFKLKVTTEMKKYERFKAAGRKRDELAGLEFKKEIAELEMEGWGEAQVYEDGLTDETRLILRNRIEDFKEKIKSAPNTPATSAPASETPS